MNEQKIELLDAIDKLDELSYLMLTYQNIQAEINVAFDFTGFLRKNVQEVVQALTDLLRKQ